MKTTLSLLALFILILGGGYVLYEHDHPAVPSSMNEPVLSAASTSEKAAPASTAAAQQAPAQAHPAKPETYTRAQVAAHATRQSCWTSINGSVYDLTQWISRHPGGEAAILSICGRDGTSAFEAQHGSAGDTRPKQMLATFKVGTLASS